MLFSNTSALAYQQKDFELKSSNEPREVDVVKFGSGINTTDAEQAISEALFRELVVTSDPSALSVGRKVLVLDEIDEVLSEMAKHQWISSVNTHQPI
ncbi:hypothetical protein TruAng_012323 [Truncatella angustata]|nr:hypothetical protein TruAng_012323 [Truncatella angustata]